jgi:polysaccharide export outer membrane protein
MVHNYRICTWVISGAILAASLATTGCQLCQPDPCLCSSPIPRELTKVSLPSYVIEPPDILEIDAVRVIPLPPYHAEPLDVLLIQVSGVLAEEPIAGFYQISSDGTVSLGFSYGSVKVSGLTIEEIRDAVTKHLKVNKKVKEPVVTIELGQSRLLQQIRGEHLVRPDGTIGLGTYGAVSVVGMTIAEAKAAIESHLSQYLLQPEVAIDILAYNSKVIYVIFDGAGNGQIVLRLPVTGNETVLDAIAQAGSTTSGAQVGGLTAVSSKHHIWVARPSQACADCDTILPVRWDDITMRGRTETNFQLLPGDRLYVQSQSIVKVDNYLAKFISPIERAFGITLLGSGVVHSVSVPLGNTGTIGGGVVP